MKYIHTETKYLFHDFKSFKYLLSSFKVGRWVSEFLLIVLLLSGTSIGQKVGKKLVDLKKLFETINRES